MDDGRLTRHERIVLKELEEALADEDPEFVVRFRLEVLALGGGLPKRVRSRRWPPRAFWDDPS